MAANKARGVQEIGKLLLDAAGGRPRRPRRRRPVTPEQQDLLERGADDLQRDSASTCHGDDGRGVPLAGAPAGTMMAPPLAGSPRVQGHRDYVDQGRCCTA